MLSTQYEENLLARSARTDAKAWKEIPILSCSKHSAAPEKHKGRMLGITFKGRFDETKNLCMLVSVPARVNAVLEQLK